MEAAAERFRALLTEQSRLARLARRQSGPERADTRKQLGEVTEQIKQIRADAKENPELSTRLVELHRSFFRA